MAEEPETLYDDDVIGPETAEETSAFIEKLDAIKARCDASKIEFSRFEGEEGKTFATISIQAGRTKKKLPIHSERAATAILAIEFEKYRFLAGYDAIYSHEYSYIEASVRSHRLGFQYVLQKMQGLRFGQRVEITPIQLAPPPSLPGRPHLEIGPCSTELNALSGVRPNRISLKLRGVRAHQHDQALAELKSYADSIFFQIESLYGATLLLERERGNRLLSAMKRRTGIELEYPTAHYNSEAMSLFWYAKTARDMPLLRFLAFYQSIEFYFPRYSQTEARRRVSSILKQPTFRAFKDDDVDRLISAIQSTKGAGIGGERPQLRAVVSECISAEEMRSYLTTSKEREDHFTSKGSKYHRIPIATKTLDLRDDVADRIYDIRCKIVHTKNEHSDDDFPMILPFSKDAEYLLFDIELAEFVAKHVLVSSSDELH